MRHSIRLTLLLLLLTGPVSGLGAGEMGAGETSSGPFVSSPPPPEALGCFACHGPDGRSARSPIPSLAGLPRGYLNDVLRAYRHGGRFSTLMGRLMQGASDAQIWVLADYFSQLEASPPKQRFDRDQAARGRQLHRRYCRECHGDEQRKPEHNAPRLNGQWMEYLRWTLQDYLFGVNQGDEEMSRALIQLIRRHGEESVEDLINYYGSARPPAPVEAEG